MRGLPAARGIDFGGCQDHALKGGEDLLSLGYEVFIAPLIKAVQELTDENAALRRDLAASVAALSDRIGRLE